MTDSECVEFLQWALPRLRMRWSGFRKVRGQVCRRLGRRCGELGLTGADAYRRYLDQHPVEWEYLDHLCVVTISRFHRDRRVFEHLRHEMLPELASRAGVEDRSFRGWSIGCASGEEPFTIALIWHLERLDRVAGTGLELLATDINPGVLERARAGRFPASSLKELDPTWIATAFEPAADEFLLRPEYRSGIRFITSDIRREVQPGPFDLILCRNLTFTYFETALQVGILEQLLPELSPEGILVIGGRESLPVGSWPLEQKDRTVPFFRKSGGPRFAPDPSD